MYPLCQGLLSQPQLVNVKLPAQASQQESSTVGRVDCDLILGTSPLQLPAHPCPAFKGRLGNKQEVCPGGTTFRGLASKTTEKTQTSSRVSTGLPTKATDSHHVWSWDFVHDRTDNGGLLKILSLIDGYTRKCLRLRIARQLPSTEVFSVLSEAIDEEGIPRYIPSDNGSVPRSKATTCEAIHR